MQKPIVEFARGTFWQSDGFSVNKTNDYGSHGRPS